MNSTAPIAHILIVDDELAQTKALCDTLYDEGYLVRGFTSPKEALAALRANPAELVLTDLMMPEMDGIAFLRAALSLDPNLVGIVMTGHGTIDSAVEAMKAGALDYILKPFKLTSILPVLNRALAVRRLRTENIELRGAVAIYELSVALAFDLDFDSALQKAASAAFHQSENGQVFILLPTGDENQFEVAIARGKGAEDKFGKRIILGRGLDSWLASYRDTVARDQDSREPAGDIGPALSELEADIAAPMVAGGKLIGILAAKWGPSARPPTLGQIKALNILAGATASALQAASLLAQLRNAEQRYRRLTENAPDVVFRYERFPLPRFAYINPAIMAVAGYTPEELCADPNLGSKMIHPEDRALWDAIIHGEVETGSTSSFRWLSKDGAVVWIEQRNVLVTDESGSVIAIEGIARDITKKRELEQQFLRQQRLESIGALAGGIAHDLNNALGPILMATEMLRSKNADADARRVLGIIESSAQRGTEMVKQVLTFARGVDGKRGLVQPKHLLKEMQAIVNQTFPKSIQFQSKLAGEIWTVMGDPTQLHQVLLNLCVNARDAMPNGGMLALRMENVQLSPEFARTQPSAKPGPYVLLCVRDSGTGIPLEILNRIFEPFFTTKPLNQGTGLGLSTVQTIVKNHGGFVTVLSELGAGTEFKVYLPAEPSASKERAEVKPRALPTGHGELILVADDESAICTITKETLLSVGYRVLVARDGAEAIALCAQHKNEIAVLITDLIMPVMDGIATIRAAKLMVPGLSVIAASGFNVEGKTAELERLEVKFLLQKPYTAEQLVTTVDQALRPPAE